MKLCKELLMIKFIDPRGRVATPIEPYNLTKKVRKNKGEGITVALLANGFPDSELFFSKIGEAIKKRLPKIDTKLWNKGNAGNPANNQMLNEITNECSIAIAGYGH
tara:strand:- start:100 stop:417 length:318 start_codon:yes stop_codon:yes gene_type:complete